MNSFALSLFFVLLHLRFLSSNACQWCWFLNMCVCACLVYCTGDDCMLAVTSTSSCWWTCEAVWVGPGLCRVKTLRAAKPFYRWAQHGRRGYRQPAISSGDRPGPDLTGSRSHTLFLSHLEILPSAPLKFLNVTFSTFKSSGTKPCVYGAFHRANYWCTKNIL